jgi:hypothetical protein
MESALTTIPGIGSSTAKILMEHGFKSLPEIAAATIAQVAAVPGFSTIRAGRIIKAANNLLSASADGDARAAQTTTSPRRAAPKPTTGISATNEKKLKPKHKKARQDQETLKKSKAKKAAEKKAKAKKIATKKIAEKKAKAKKAKAKKATEKKAKAKKIAAKKITEKKAKAKKAKAKKATSKKNGGKKGKSKP